MTPGLVQADDFQGLGFLPGTNTSVASGLSANGQVVIGSAFISGSSVFSDSFVWANGVINQITGAGVGFLSQPNAVNADGSVVVGFTYGSGSTGYVWTPSGGAVVFPAPPGYGVSLPTGVNADGSVIVGDASGNLPERAFRWTQTGGMVVLGVLPGGTTSDAAGVSADGNVVVGTSGSGSQTKAFRWTQSGGMTDIGYLPGATFTAATATNYDGSVVVGFSSNPAAHAFRWQMSTGLAALPELPGSQSSAAWAVNYSGSVIVGYSGPDAAIWTATNGVRSIKSLLAASGVNLTGWNLTEAKGVSADGTIVAGNGANPSGQLEAWIARISGTDIGLITFDTVQQSFSGLAATVQTANATIGHGLTMLSDTAIQAGATQNNNHKTPFAAFAYAGYDSDPAATGALGMTVDLPNAMVGGAAVSGSVVNTNMAYGGSSQLSGGGLGMFLARVPEAGLQWFAGIQGITLTGDIKRGYLNGNDVTSSTGSTTANGYGYAGRIGWTFANLWPATQVTPFASYTFSSIRLNDYTETTGAFPAQFNAFSDNAQTSRLGADARYTFAPGEWVWGTLAWAHRLDGGAGSKITGTLIGLFSLTAQGSSVAPDWAEITAGVRMPLSQNGAFTASLTASVQGDAPTTYNARIGLTQAF